MVARSSRDGAVTMAVSASQFRKVTRESSSSIVIGTWGPKGRCGRRRGVEGWLAETRRPHARNSAVGTDVRARARSSSRAWHTSRHSQSRRSCTQARRLHGTGDGASCWLVRQRRRLRRPSWNDVETMERPAKSHRFTRWWGTPGVRCDGG